MNIAQTRKPHRLRQLAYLVIAGLSLLGSQAQADTKVRSSSFEYDASGVLNKETVEPDRPNDCLQTSYSYDVFGNKTGISTSACAGASGATLLSAGVARTSASNYGADGRFPVSSSNALSQSETKVFDARFGVLTSLTGPNGLTTTWAYDGFGRKTQETRADGTKTTWAYKLCTEAGANCPSSVGPATITWLATEQSLDANGAASAPEKRQYYDTLNRVVRVQTQGFDGVGVAAPTLLQDTEYNALGQVARRSNVYASTGSPVWTSYTYDALGRMLTQSQPDSAAPGGIATTSYAYNGLSSTITNANGKTQTTLKNAQGQVASVTDSLGNTITYSYDALGNLTQTNAAGSITTLQYNQRGHKIAMQDPAMGSWTYSYNAYGELVSQRDSLNQTTTLAYDVLGRLIKRTEPDLVSDWSFDTKFDGTACGLGKGKLCEAKTDNGYKRTHAYDTKGRISSTATTLDSTSSPLTVSVTYDPITGRVANKTWPTGYQASYGYTALGYLKTVTGGGTNGFTAIQNYQVLAINAQGQVTQYKTGNNVTTVSTYDLQTQRLTGQTATTDGQAAGNVLNQSYSYDSLGNLLTRNDTSPGVGTQESFGYDSLNRLTMATILGGSVSPPTSTQVIYDARGNIAYKSDVGRYWYDGARPNRMTNVTLETVPGAQPLTGTRALSYAFDDANPGVQSINGVTVGNGNLAYTVSQDTVNNRHTVRYEAYTSFNMPRQIVYGNFITNTSSTADRTLDFVYGPEHQRVKQAVNLTGNGTSAYFAGSTWYLNGEDSLGLTYEKEVRANGTTEHKHYLSAGGFTFALFTSRTGTLNGLAATSTSYFHKDQLGSISAITDETGVVVERLAYDPWGKRRFINTTPGQPDNLDAIVGIRTDRGYTEHEHLDEVGIIHMNGRIYDPLMGRFMSADPNVTDPSKLQSYNRYSYVMNNPLFYTDPTGFDWWSDFRDNVVKPVAVAVAAYYTGGAVAGWYEGAAVATTLGGGTAVTIGGFGISGTAAIIGGAAGGFVAGSLTTGTLEGGLQGALTGSLFGAAGTVGAANSWGRYAAHAVAGCVSSVAGGGGCEGGAASAVFGKFTTNAIGGVSADASLGEVVAKGVATAVAGGVGSVIAGGKFENGAATAAYGYLFNALLTQFRNGQSLRANYKGTDGGRQEHAVEGPGGSRGPNGESYGYHAHVYDSNGKDTGVKIHTHPDKFGQPLTVDDAKRMTSEMAKNIAEINLAERRVIYQMNRAVFHTGNVPTQLRLKAIAFKFPFSKRGD